MGVNVKGFKVRTLSCKIDRYISIPKTIIHRFSNANIDKKDRYSNYIRNHGGRERKTIRRPYQSYDNSN